MHTAGVADAFRDGAVVLATAWPDAMSDAALAVGLAWLDAAERRRRDAFVFDRDRRLFLAAHALTRALLGACLGAQPQALSFETDAFGRPHLVARGADAASRLVFSLSHTHGFVACAAWRDGQVGVDVEGLARARDEVALARSFFAASEAQAIERLEGAARAERFMATWTLKEAYAKARGLGLNLPFTSFEFPEPEASAPQVRFVGADDGDGVDGDAARWHFWSRRCGAAHRLALACAGAARPRVREFEWVARASGEHAFASAA